MDFLYQFIQSGIDCTTFHRFFSWNVRNFSFFYFQKFAGLWLVGKVDNHVAIYGSKVAEGFSAFQRRLVDFFFVLKNTTVKDFYSWFG